MFFRFIEEYNNQSFTNNLWSGSTFPTTTTLLVNNPKLYLGQLTSTINPRTVNELSASWTYQPLDLSLNGNYQRPSGLNIPELFPENRQNRIPNISISGGSSMNYDLASWPWTNAAEIFIVRDNLTLNRGAHTVCGRRPVHELPQATGSLRADERKLHFQWQLHGARIR